MKFDVEKSKKVMWLKQLAEDICNHYVFTSHHIPEAKMGEMFTVVYPIMLAGDVFKAKIDRDEVGLIYEYMKNAEAKDKWVDGYPVFSSFQYLLKEDAELLRGYVNTIMSAKKKDMANGKEA